MLVVPYISFVLGVSSSFTSHIAAATGTALVGHDAKAPPASATDVVRLRHAVKRAPIEDGLTSPSVQVPEPEMRNILSQLEKIKDKVKHYLLPKAPDEEKPVAVGQKCGARQPGQVGHGPPFDENANCSSTDDAAAQKPDLSGEPSGKDASSHSPDAGENKASPDTTPDKTVILNTIFTKTLYLYKPTQPPNDAKFPNNDHQAEPAKAITDTRATEEGADGRSSVLSGDDKTPSGNTSKPPLEGSQHMFPNSTAKPTTALNDVQDHPGASTQVLTLAQAKVTAAFAFGRARQPLGAGGSADTTPLSGFRTVSTPAPACEEETVL